MITVSIVSHGHGGMVDRLIEQLLKVELVSQIILTLNIPQFIEIKNNEKLIIINNYIGLLSSPFKATNFLIYKT